MACIRVLAEEMKLCILLPYQSNLFDRSNPITSTCSEVAPENGANIEMKD